jgi:hypothetical protein
VRRAPFSEEKFVALARYIVQRDRPMPSERLACLMFILDMEAYRDLGDSITGATWMKGAVHPECRELGEGWFRQFTLAEMPWWARWAGRCFAFLAVVHAASSPPTTNGGRR